VNTVFKHLPALLHQHAVPANGVVHVGAHQAQERDVYRECGFKRKIWVEPHPDLAARLRQSGLEVAECAIVRRPGPVTLHVTGWDQQSSVLRPTRYPVTSTLTVDGRRLDQLDTAGCNLLVVDVQGAELSVLRSGPLNQFNMIIVECSTVARYKRAPTPDQVIGWLMYRRYKLVASYGHGKHGKVADHVLVRA
jgi:FkbM family methyltransferase